MTAAISLKKCIRYGNMKKDAENSIRRSDGMIPLKIETLLDGRVVEHDRVEYKTGWNPNTVIHSICAFANDLPGKRQKGLSFDWCMR